MSQFRGGPRAFNSLKNVIKEQGSRRSGSGNPLGPKGFLFGTGGLVLLGALGFAANSSLFNVDGGHRAIKYSRVSGVSDRVFPEGTHIKIPWFESVIDYDVRAKPINIASLTGTKDLQMVNIVCRVLSRPDTLMLPQIYRTIGADYDGKVIPSIVHEALKSVIAQFTASQLITEREKISHLIRENMTRRARRFNVILDDVSLTHVQFSPDFAAAVEQKQIAQQEVQKAVFVVESARQEKEAKIVAGQGEARAAELIGIAIGKNPAYLELKRVETAREIAHILSDGKNKLMLDAEALLLNVSNKDNENSKK